MFGLVLKQSRMYIILISIVESLISLMEYKPWTVGFRRPVLYEKTPWWIIPHTRFKQDIDIRFAICLACYKDLQFRKPRVCIHIA